MLATATFDEAILARSHEGPVVVAFLAGIAPLKAWFENVLAREVRARNGLIGLAVVDVDRDPGLAARFGVQVVPTVQAFRNGECVGAFVSARRPADVSAFLDSLLGPREDAPLREELRAHREWPDVVAALDELDYERAFERLLARAAGGNGDQRERARRAMVTLFAELGDAHPLTARYRARLAATLY